MDSRLGISAFPPYLNAEKESHPALFPIGRFSMTSFPIEFSQPFQSSRSLSLFSLVFACYTRIRRYHYMILRSPHPPSPNAPFPSMPHLPVHRCPPRTMPALAASRIQLKFRHLHEGTRIIDPPDHPCDATCEKMPPHASQTLGPQTQPIENEGLKTSSL